ncbi:hypothetical protein Droror1_Dr00000892 [Drosera rotundifolia]
MNFRRGSESLGPTVCEEQRRNRGEAAGKLGKGKQRGSRLRSDVPAPSLADPASPISLIISPSSTSPLLHLPSPLTSRFSPRLPLLPHLRFCRDLAISHPRASVATSPSLIHSISPTIPSKFPLFLIPISHPILAQNGDKEVAAATVSRRRDSVVDIGSRVSSVVNGEGSICSPVKDEVRDDMEKMDGVLHCCSPVGGDSGGSRKKKRGGGVRNRDLVVGLRKDEVDFFQQDFVIPCEPSPGRVFLECLSLSSSGLTFHDDEDDGYHSGADRVDCLYRSGYLSGSSSFLNGMARAGIARSVDRQQFRGSLNASMFGSKSRWLHQP